MPAAPSFTRLAATAQRRAASSRPVTPHLVAHRLIHKPAIPDRVPAWPGSSGQQRRKPLHPAVDADVVNFDAAFGEQLLKVAVRPTAQTAGTSGPRARSPQGGKQRPANADRGVAAGPERRVLMVTVCLLWLAHSRCNSAAAGVGLMSEAWGADLV
jgi:hypothetical protein